MTRESPYRIHRALAETRQRPYAPPQPPRRRLRVRVVLLGMAGLLAIAGAVTFAIDFVADFFRRIG